MINEHDAVRRLVLVCPGFHESLVAYRDSGGDANESFVLIGALAEWVVHQASAGDFTCFTELFNELESTLGKASPDARDVLIIGFLEDLHNLTVRHNKPADQIHPDVLLKYLGPRSRAEWFRLVQSYMKWGESWPGQTSEDATRID